MQRTCLVLAGLCLSAGIACADPTGQWMVEKGYARIRIENCGNSIWGAVVWELTPGTDSKNPDATKRGRPTLGMPVLLDMKPVDPNKWSGKIYNSEDGQTYSSNISLPSPDVLRVQGCVLGILCGGENWTRVNDPLAPGGPVGTGGSRHSAARERDCCCNSAQAERSLGDVGAKAWCRAPASASLRHHDRERRRVLRNRSA